MQLSLCYSFALIMLAGVMNGSFVIPARYFSAFDHEKTWLYHSIIGCIALPWLYVLAISSASIHYTSLLPTPLLLFLLASGLIFGLGQICFSQAIKIMGVGRSFTINLSLGVALGSLFVVIYRQLLFTTQGAQVVFAVILINVGLYLHYKADTASDKNQAPTTKSVYPQYRRGWLLATFTGLTSALQNIAFVLTAFHLPPTVTKADGFWIWPAFLSAAAIPMIVGFGVYLKPKQKPQRLSAASVIKTLLAITCMGLLFTGSLVFYSHAMMNMTHQQQITAWPTFMVTIILTSQLWDKRLAISANEIKNLQHKRLQYTSIVLCLLAILILAANQ